VQRTGLTFVLLLALPALAITACGGDDGSATGDPTGGHGREAGTASTPPSDAKPPSGSSDSPGPAQEPSDAPESDSDSGGGSAQFRGRGDNSVQELGSEADDPEFEQAAAVLHGYLDALAAGRWKAACSYMESGFRDSVEQLGGSCAPALAGMSGGPSPAAAEEAAVADAGALRVDGNQGFILFHGVRHSDFFMPVAREEGRWKIAALAASELP